MCDTVITSCVASKMHREKIRYKNPEITIRAMFFIDSIRLLLLLLQPIDNTTKMIHLKQVFVDKWMQNNNASDNVILNVCLLHEIIFKCIYYEI